MRKLYIGDEGEEVRKLQAATNRRSDPRGLPRIEEDGKLGLVTLTAVRRAGRALGALEQTLRLPYVSVGLQRLIRHPGLRTLGQFNRARQRAKAERPARAASMRERAWEEAGTVVGITEQGGNNRGRDVEKIIAEGGGLPGQAWCGWFCAAMYKRAGSKAVTWRWGAVRLYLPGWGLTRTTAPLRGCLVRFTFDHIGLFGNYCDAGGRECPRSQATHIRTREGNTGPSGATQSNDNPRGGDGAYEKIRPLHQVRDFILVQA